MIDLKQGDCLELMKEIPDKSVDAIITDPPYEYLKHKLDRPFDEQAVFNEWDRIVKDDGFLVFFGRGASFHRWNYLLNEMGWKFKEEIVWDKRRISNMMGSISRIHETVSVLTRKGKIRESRIPYVEKNEYNFEKIERDLSRIKSAFRNKAFLETLESYINGEKNHLY